MPLRWRELSARKTNELFTIRNAVHRVRRWKEKPLEGVVGETPDLKAAITRLER